LSPTFVRRQGAPGSEPGDPGWLKYGSMKGDSAVRHPDAANGTCALRTSSTTSGASPRQGDRQPTSASTRCRRRNATTTNCRA
jgi:hypothetical protein